MKASARQTRGLRHAFRAIALVAFLVIARAGLYIYGKSSGGAAQAPTAAPATAVSDAVPQTAPEAPVIPAAELADLANPPNPATLEAVVARARELCHAQGTGERAITFDELREMAGGKIAAFDAASRRGFTRTPEDSAWYLDAKELLRDYNADGSAGGEEELGSQPAADAQL